MSAHAATAGIDTSLPPVPGWLILFVLAALAIAFGQDVVHAADVVCRSGEPSGTTCGEALYAWGFAP